MDNTVHGILHRRVDCICNPRKHPSLVGLPKAEARRNEPDDKLRSDAWNCLLFDAHWTGDHVHCVVFTIWLKRHLNKRAHTRTLAAVCGFWKRPPPENSHNEGSIKSIQGVWSSGREYWMDGCVPADWWRQSRGRRYSRRPLATVEVVIHNWSCLERTDFHTRNKRSSERSWIETELIPGGLSPVRLRLIMCPISSWTSHCSSDFLTSSYSFAHTHVHTETGKDQVNKQTNIWLLNTDRAV